MKTIKYAISICLCFVCFAARGQGQVTVNRQNFLTINQQPEININVIDAETQYPIESAVVKLVIAEKDTVNLVCDKYGWVRYDKRMPVDSLVFTISHLGYRELRHVHKITGPYISLTARLEVDPLEIATVIVEGEIVKMVFRGDTTIHNAAAYRTMRGDSLEDLLKKISTVEFRDGGIFEQGKRVHRIKIDDMHMFASSFTEDALQLVRADDVENIRAYDEHSPENVAYGDTINKPKQRVLDVTTKSKPKIIKQRNISSSYGIYADKNQSGDHVGFYNVGGAYNRHLVGNNFRANLQYGKNTHSSGLIPMNSLGSDIIGLWNWDKNIDNYKYHLQSFMNYNDKRNTDLSSSHTDYFPSETYYSRKQTNETRSDIRIANFNNTNSIGFRIKERHMALASVNINNAINRTDIRNYSDIIIDDAISYLSNSRVYNRMDNLKVSTTFKYTHNFKKNGRKLDTEISYAYIGGWGDGWSVDTLASSTQNIFLTSSKNDRGGNFGGNVAYTSLSLFEEIEITPSYNVSRQNIKSTLLSVDRLTGMPDMQNTYDHTYNYLHNSLSAGFNFKSLKGLRIGLNAQFARQNREESNPEEMMDLRSYFNLMTNLNYMYARSAMTIRVSYSENVSLPSIEQTTSVLDTYRAPVYTAGNPSLKETFNRKLNVNINTMNIENYNNWNFDANINLYQNAHVTQEYFFSSATQRPEYGGFTFPAGSTLRTPRNASGRFSLQTKVRFSTPSKLLGSKINAEVGYSYDRMPYYISETLDMNDMHACRIDLGLTSDFSEIIEIRLSSRTWFGYTERDKNSNFKEIGEGIYGQIRFNFAKRLWIKADGSFDYRDTSLPNTALKKVILNCEFACKFGEDDKGSLSLLFNDIFNQTRSLSVAMENDYTVTTRTTVLGRNVCIRLSYGF